MTLESALNAWLSQLTGLDCYWLHRPPSAQNAVVYRCLTPGSVEGNLRQTGIKDDSYSLTIYHQDPDEAKRLADRIVAELHGFNGLLSGYPVQYARLSGGFEQPLLDESGECTSYQFNRDFFINH